MERKARRIDYSPDRLLAGIAGRLITAEEFGIYWMVCTLIYDKGGPIDDDAAWIAGIFKSTDPRTVRAALARLEKLSKIHRVGSKLMANGCQDELELAANRIRKAAENGSKGGRHSRKTKELEKATGYIPDNQPAPPSPSPSPSPIPKKEEDQSETPPTELFPEPNGSPPKYAFSGDVIRLTHTDYQKFQRKFKKLNGNFDRELTKADAYYRDHPPRDGKWYFPLTKWLAKAEQDASASGAENESW